MIAPAASSVATSVKIPALPVAAASSSGEVSPFATLIGELHAAWSEVGDPLQGNSVPSTAATPSPAQGKTSLYSFLSSAPEVSAHPEERPVSSSGSAPASMIRETSGVWKERTPAPQVSVPVQTAKAVEPDEEHATTLPGAPHDTPRLQSLTKRTAAHPASAAKPSIAVVTPAPVPVQDESAVVRRAGSSSGKDIAPPPASEDSPEQPEVTSPVAEPNVQALPVPAAANAIPAEFRPVRARALAGTAIASGPKPSATAQIPFFATPAQVPIPITLPKFKADGGSGPQERTSTTPQTEDAAPAERATLNDAALEVRIKAPAHEGNPKAPATTADPVSPTVPAAVPATAVPSEPVTLKPLPELPVAQAALQPVSAPAVNPAQAFAAEVTVRTPEAPAHPPTQSAPSTARSTDIEEPVTTPDTQQPVRSMSLEFSPDGAGDVRLRLSEKSGEIHISLHSSDASLSSRLHEGVHDLVGSLSSAGYEAEAWTPGQGHQSNQREPEQRKNRRTDSQEAGETFGDVFQQPIQEIS